jgi:hypothetical protein
MNTVHIAASTAHVLSHMVYGYDGEPITGLVTLFVRIWRPSDGFFWNWNTSAFVSAPSSGDRDKTLVEASSTTMPGLYTISWPGTVAGEYVAYYEQSSGGTDYNAPEPEMLIVGSLATVAALATAQTAITDLQARTPAALVSGRMDASIGAAAANTITASALAADAVTEIQSGLATSSAVAALPTSAAIADAVWDELLSGHTVDGSAAAALALVDVATSTRATAASVWATAEGTPSSGTMAYAQALMRKWITNRLVVSTTSSGTEVLYDDDASTALLTWTLRDGSNNAITTPSGSPAARGEAT